MTYERGPCRILNLAYESEVQVVERVAIESATCTVDWTSSNQGLAVVITFLLLEEALVEVSAAMGIGLIGLSAKRNSACGLTKFGSSRLQFELDCLVSGLAGMGIA